MVGTARDAPFAHPTASISKSIIRSHSLAISPHILREVDPEFFAF
jgi:hypothetical protein